MAQTILNNKQSSNGSPYAFYTVEVTPSGRTANTVNLAITVKSHLQYSESFQGTGIILTGYLKISGVSYEIPLKSRAETWSGTTVHTASKNITVTGLSASATSITGVIFRVVNAHDNSSSLSDTSCSNITIPVGNSLSGLILGNTNTFIGDSISSKIDSVVSSNTHKIVVESGSHSYTMVSGKCGGDLDLKFPVSRFTPWFDTASKTLDVTLTLTTYNSSGTSLGSVKRYITIVMTGDVGKPSIPVAVIGERTVSGATILLTEPSTFKYGATFKNWKVSANEGTVSVSGNTITATVDVNKTAIVSIQAVDSRGFESDVVNLAYHLRKRGFCIYKDGIWKPCKAIVYMNGAHTKTKNRIYNNGWKA